MGVQSLFDAIAVQTGKLLAMHVCMDCVCYAKAKEDWWHQRRRNLQKDRITDRPTKAIFF